MNKKTDKIEAVYDASSISVLKGLSPVRLRPAMYIGDTGKRGLHHLVWEVVDNSVDEAMGGHCDTISVTIESDGKTITVEDNGRGIPVDEQEDEKRSALEVVLTVLHAGGKFGGSGYTASGGLHGVGVSCVNALSSLLVARVWRDGGAYEQTYKQGEPQTSVIRTGDSRKHGTSIQFTADETIFIDGITFDEALLERRFRETAFLNGGLKIVFNNKHTGKQETYQYAGGISDYVKYLTDVQTGHYPTTPFFTEKRQDRIVVQVSFQYTENDNETLLSFANNINTHDGGTHLSGFKTAFTRVVNAVGRKNGNIKDKDSNLNGDDIREGITAVISVRLPQPQFEGQTKAKLGSPEMDGIVQALFGEALNEYFEKNPAIVKMIVERAQLNQRAREAAKKSAETIKKTGASRIFANAGKLKPCRSRDNNITELFIVEGDSASGSAKDGRDSGYQAILPIRGKIINAEKKDLLALLKNKEIESLVTVIGAGIQTSGSDNTFNIDDRKYSKIIIMTDADVDGSHIATLLLTFFYRYMRPLVEQGHVYLVQPPLYRVDVGSKQHYCWSEDEKNKALASGSGKTHVTRFKGLGEMDEIELGETTMFKGARRLIQVSVEDAADAERMLSVLMGKDVSARKAHIIEHSKKRALSNQEVIN
jgi:DNA gyrase subunit B